MIETNAINTQIVSLSDTNHAVGSYNWKLKNQVSFVPVNAASVVTNANNVPDVATIFSPLNTIPNLTILAEEGNTAANGAKNLASTIMGSSRSSLKGNISTSLGNVQTTLVDGLTPLNQKLMDLIRSIKNQIQTYLPMVNEYNTYRGYGHMALVLVYLLPVLFMSISGLARKPGCMKCCNLLCVPYYFLLFVFAAIFLISAAILGDVCDVAFTDKPSPISTLFPMIGTGLDVTESCYTGKSLITVAEGLGIGVDAKSLNLASLAKDQINKFNFSSVTNFDLSSIITLSSDPATQVSSIVNMSLVGMNTASLDTIHSKNIPDLRTNFANVRAIIQALYNNASYPQLNVTGGTPSSLEQIDIVNAYKAELDSILSKIDALTLSSTGDLSTIDDASVTLSSSILATNTTANNLKVCYM
jgi:hypothetical protein